MELPMILIYIVMLIALVTIIGVLVWFALQDQDLDCTNNGCTQKCDQGRRCSCNPTPETPKDDFGSLNWPFPRNRP
jgi:hypothetical protein